MNTAPRISVSGEKLYGRQFELAQLQGAYDHLVSKHDTEMVLVGGYAGTGKTKLVTYFRDRLLRRPKFVDTPCYFLSGKADELLHVEPCSSLVDAFSGLCRDLLKCDEDELQRVRKRILEAVADDGKVLTDLIPNLIQIIGTQPELSGQRGSKQNALNRLNYIFQRFVKAVATRERPLILFLDDLQWTDSVSLDFLSLLVTDTSLKHFMLIGSYRDNEVETNGSLISSLGEIRKKGKSFLTISLGNLGYQDVATLVADAISTELEESEPLAKSIFAKTHGNVFYTMASLQMLDQQNILTYSYSTLKWVWNEAEVVEKLGISDNVVALLVTGLESMSPQLQNIMTTAAFLRNSFYVNTLFYLLQAQDSSVLADVDSLVTFLDVAVGEGFLENAVGSPRYSFAHDRIHEATLTLVKGNDRDKLSLLIGKSLIELSSSPGVEEGLLFVAVDLLSNSVPSHVLQEHIARIRLAELYLQVGQEATAISAFAPARKYLGKGIEHVESFPNRWQSHYDLCLALYSTAADVEFGFGSFDRAKYFADEVVDNAKTFLEKLPAYRALAEGLGQRKRQVDAFEIEKKMLNSLDEMPKHTYLVGALWKLKSLNATFKKLTDDDVLSLPVLENEEKSASCLILSKMSVRAHLTNQRILALCCFMHSIRLMLKYGLCDSGAYALGGYGSFLVSKTGEAKLGRRMGNLALRISERLDENRIRSQIIFPIAHYIEAWYTPLPRVMKLLNTGYISGMFAGQLEFAFSNFMFHSVFSYASGLPLAPAVGDVDLLSSMLEKYNVETVEVIFVPFKHLILGLIGRLEDPLDFRAEVEIKKGLALRESQDPSLFFKHLWKYFCRAQLAYWLGDMPLAEKMRCKADKYISGQVAYLYKALYYFFSCLISTGMHRETKKLKYKRFAKKMIKNMEKLVKTKGFNTLHKLLIMKAEFAATFHSMKDTKDTKTKFDRAIKTASKSGFLQDAALASELAAEYFLRCGDNFWAKHYFTAACNIYIAWGAHKKTTQLLQLRGAYIDEDREMVQRMHISRESRDSMSKGAMAMHNTVDPARRVSDWDSSELMSSSRSLSATTAFQVTDHSSSKLGDELSSSRISLTSKAPDSLMSGITSSLEPISAN